jgi:hypothetical protein
LDEKEGKEENLEGNLQVLWVFIYLFLRTSLPNATIKKSILLLLLLLLFSLLTVKFQFLLCHSVINPIYILKKEK